MTDSTTPTKAPAQGPDDQRLRAAVDVPDPSRLRTACVLVYVGLLLSLIGLFIAPAASAVTSGQRALAPQPGQNRDYERHESARTVDHGPARKAGEEECGGRREVPGPTRSVRCAASQTAVRFEGWMLALPAAAAALLAWRYLARRRREGQRRNLADRRRLALREFNARLDEQSRTDASTGIANHRRLRFYLTERWLEARSGGRPISVVAMEIDGVGGLSATRLRELAVSLARRVEDEGGLLARFEGAEFMAVLPDRPPSEATELAEALRRLLRSGGGSESGRLSDALSASIGVAGVNRVESSAAERLVHRARNAMRDARQAGGDRVIVRDAG